MKKEKGYTRQFAVWMGIYAVMHLPMIMLMGIMESITALGSLNCLFVVLPLLPMLFALRAFVRDIGTLDELQRRIHLEAFAFSLGCTGMLTFSYGMLETFGDAPRGLLIMVLPLAIFFWFVGATLARRKYQ